MGPRSKTLNTPDGELSTLCRSHRRGLGKSERLYALRLRETAAEPC